MLRSPRHATNVLRTVIGTRNHSDVWCAWRFAGAALAMVLCQCGGNITSSHQGSSGRDGGDSEGDSSISLDDSGVASSVDGAGVAPPMGDDAGSVSDAQVLDDSSSQTVNTDSCMVRVSDYDQTCTTDSTCVVVPTGNCHSDTCARGAINIREFGAYTAALAAAQITVPGGPGCSPGPACCQAGHCAECWDAAGPNSLYSPTFTVLCVADAGPQDAGMAVSGVSLWCVGSEVCTPVNGEWECCQSITPTEQSCNLP